MSENENLPNLETPSNEKILKKIVRASKNEDDFINALNQVFDNQTLSSKVIKTGLSP